MLDDIGSADDGQEISIPADDTTIDGRYIKVITSGAGTKLLKIVTARGNTRTFTTTDGWSMAIKFTKILGSGNGTTVTLVQVGQ